MADAPGGGPRPSSAGDVRRGGCARRSAEAPQNLPASCRMGRGHHLSFAEGASGLRRDSCAGTTEQHARRMVAVGPTRDSPLPQAIDPARRPAPPGGRVACSRSPFYVFRIPIWAFTMPIEASSLDRSRCHVRRSERSRRPNAQLGYVVAGRIDDAAHRLGIETTCPAPAARWASRRAHPCRAQGGSVRGDNTRRASCSRLCSACSMATMRGPGSSHVNVGSDSRYHTPSSCCRASAQWG